jgi:hypothetical protein
MPKAGRQKHEWELSFNGEFPFTLRSPRRLSQVPDYGYYSWLFHPVSSTIFPSLWLSCRACYNPTFMLLIRLSRRITFLNEVVIKCAIVTALPFMVLSVDESYLHPFGCVTSSPAFRKRSFDFPPAFCEPTL